MYSLCVCACNTIEFTCVCSVTYPYQPYHVQAITLYMYHVFSDVVEL